MTSLYEEHGATVFIPGSRRAAGHNPWASSVAAKKSGKGSPAATMRTQKWSMHRTKQLIKAETR